MVKVRLQLIFLATLISAQFAAADESDIINPKWVKPGWKRNQLGRTEDPTAVPECQCQTEESLPKKIPSEEENNRLAFVFYKKFLIKLFDEKKLEFDQEDPSFKLRNVQLKITDRQLSKLKEAQTARDVDSVVTSIVEQSDACVYQAMAETLCWNVITLYGSAMQSATFIYVIIPALAILFVLCIGKLLGIRRLWILFPVLGILITYVLTYRDCNNRLELESLTKLMKQSDGSNPCGKHRQSGWLNQLLYKYNEAECIEHLREQYGLRRSFCDPTEVFIDMVAKLHLQYFETFVLKMVSIFKISTASSGIMETLLISGFILFLIYLLMTVGIKYGLYAGGRFFADVITKPRTSGRVANQEQLPPTAPFNISININRPRRANSRAEQITSRIEEITEGTSEPNVAGELMPATVEETSRRKEDGSGDGLQHDATDEGESSDGETIMIKCDLAEGVGKDTAKNSTDNQSKPSVDQ